MLKVVGLEEEVLEGEREVREYFVLAQYEPGYPVSILRVPKGKMCSKIEGQEVENIIKEKEGSTYTYKGKEGALTRYPKVRIEKGKREIKVASFYVMGEIHSGLVLIYQQEKGMLICTQEQIRTRLREGERGANIARTKEGRGYRYLGGEPPRYQREKEAEVLEIEKKGKRVIVEVNSLGVGETGGWLGREKSTKESIECIVREKYREGLILNGYSFIGVILDKEGEEEGIGACYTLSVAIYGKELAEELKKEIERLKKRIKGLE